MARDGGMGFGWIGLLAGAWLLIAPTILGYGFIISSRNDTYVGIVIGVLSLARMIGPRMAWASWLNVLAGIWLVLAPITLNLMNTAMIWNDVTVGVIVAATSVWSGLFAQSLEVVMRTSRV